MMRTHVVSALGTYELPFGRQAVHGPRQQLANGILGGWQLSGVFTAASGFPVSVQNGIGIPQFGTSGVSPRNRALPAQQTTKNAPRPYRDSRRP